MRQEFAAEIWIWGLASGNAAVWHFVTVPEDISAQIRLGGPDRRKAFGSVPTKVTLGSKTWRTSVFPDKKSGCYLLPIKADVRKANKVAAGDRVKIVLDLDL